MEAFPFLCVSLQRTASKGRGAASPGVWMRGEKHHGQATRLSRWQVFVAFHKVMEQTSLLWTPLSHFLWRFTQFRHALPCCPALPLLCLLLVFIPTRTDLPSQWREPTPYAGTGSPREAWGDAESCPQAHLKQRDLSPFPTPLLACCKSLEPMLLGKGLGFVYGLKNKARMGWPSCIALGEPKEWGCPWWDASQGAPKWVLWNSRDPQEWPREAQELVIKAL